MARLVCALLLLAVATASASESRIVGGWPTIIENYPSVVQVQRSVIGIWVHRCGGSLLTSTYFLTSAGCFRVPPMLWKTFRINAGSTYRSVGGQFSDVAYVIPHPSWNDGLNYEGDIAVVILQTPLQYSNVVQQAAILAQGAFIPDNMPSTQLGWGVNFGQAFPGLFSDVLLSKDVLTINNLRCALNLAGAIIPINVTPNMLCAGGLHESGACVGDRGGPLIINGITAGVCIRTWGCSNATQPALYTAISSYTNWIVNTVSTFKTPVVL